MVLRIIILKLFHIFPSWLMKFLVIYIQTVLPQLTPSANAKIAESFRAIIPKQSAIGSPLFLLVIGFFSYNVLDNPYAKSEALFQSLIPPILFDESKDFDASILFNYI